MEKESDRKEGCFMDLMGFMTAVMAAIAVMAMARMAFITMFTRATAGATPRQMASVTDGTPQRPTPTNSRQIHTISRQIRTECRVNRRSNGQERPLLPCTIAPSRA